MINRIFLPCPRLVTTEWPDYETAPIRDICAPISGGLDSPRGNPFAGVGYIMSPRALAAKVARAREAYRRRKNDRKFA